MKSYKETEKRKIKKILLDLPTEDISDEDISFAEVKKSIDRLSKIFQYEIIQEEVDKIPVWPIDFPIITRLTAMTVSIITIIIANFIMKRIIHL
jgi:hypothetical protein